MQIRKSIRETTKRLLDFLYACHIKLTYPQVEIRKPDGKVLLTGYLFDMSEISYAVYESGPHGMMLHGMPMDGQTPVFTKDGVEVTPERFRQLAGKARLEARDRATDQLARQLGIPQAYRER